MTEGKPDFKALAEDLCESPTSLFHTIMMKQKVAELEEWYEQIQRRNRRIRELKTLLLRASVYVTAEAKPGYDPPRDKGFARVLLDEIERALDHDKS